jgi:hypothetical protein
MVKRLESSYLNILSSIFPGWLEPLLDRIARNSTTVVCPVIDVIDDSTLEYHFRDSGGVNVGGFDWNLQFNWHAVPEKEKKRHKVRPSVPIKALSRLLIPLSLYRTPLSPCGRQQWLVACSQFPESFSSAWARTIPASISGAERTWSCPSKPGCVVVR